jgi:phage replication O-like protein O
LLKSTPQIENGYTRIANELLEAIISFNFSSRQLNVLFSIIRCTYGYNKKSDSISGWQISKMTNIDRSNISKTINELIKLNVLIKHENGRLSHGFFVNELSINKDYKTWTTVAKTTTVVKTTPLLKSDKTVVNPTTVTVVKTTTTPWLKQPTHKDIPKDIKETKESTLFSDVDKNILNQWLAVRKKKKGAELSEIVFKAMIREANKAGISLEQAIIECVERNWIAFNAQWYFNATISTSKFKNKSNVISDQKFDDWLNSGENDARHTQKAILDNG